MELLFGLIYLRFHIKIELNIIDFLKIATRTIIITYDVKCVYRPKYETFFVMAVYLTK
jgi:hypothetical protein